MFSEVEIPGLTEEVKHNLQLLAMYGMPNEVCGVLHPNHIIHQYPNTFCGDTKHGFDMEIDIKDMDIVAIWHSHPRGPNNPSDDDTVCMKHLYDHGYRFPWIIVTNQDVKAYVYDECIVHI